MSKITLNTERPLQLDMPNTICEPFIVRRDGRTIVVVKTSNTIILFDTNDGSISYSDTPGYLRDNYKFVRFLDKGESFTYTK